MLEVGMKHTEESHVVFLNTAASLGSGSVAVLGTPYMIALMEEACAKNVSPHLPEGQTSVGTYVNVEHNAATPIGLKIWATSELIEIDRKALTFKVEAFDERGKIGEGTHGRFIVDYDKFIEKAYAK